MTMTHTESDAHQALSDAAAHVERNRLNSHEWCASVESFDLIKFATPAPVLEVVALVKSMNLNPAELAALLRGRAGRRE